MSSVVKPLKQNLVISIVNCIVMLMGFIMSFMEMPLEQANILDINSTLLGYNRDFLVDWRWWFLVAFVISLVVAFWSLRILYKMAKQSPLHIK